MSPRNEALLNTLCAVCTRPLAFHQDNIACAPVTPPDAPDAPRDLLEHEAVLEVINGAFDEISRICQERWNGKEGWRMSIPARRGYDSDLILVDALVAARNFIRSVGASRPGEPR